MFVQVITGKVTDAAAVRAAFDRWLDELAPGAKGWLGSTAGVTVPSKASGGRKPQSCSTAKLRFVTARRSCRTSAAILTKRDSSRSCKVSKAQTRIGPKR